MAKRMILRILPSLEKRGNSARPTFEKGKDKRFAFCSIATATNNYRSNHGWKGADLCHSISSPVRISHYCVQYGGNNISNGEGSSGVGTTLTGLAHFTKNAESHSKYCHGGSMTSTMDDVIGWTAFHVTGECKPWSGFTAQVNVSLKRPIPVGSYLKIVGVVTKTERRKVWIESRLVGGGEHDAELVYCTAEGLVILKKNDVCRCRFLSSSRSYGIFM